MDQGAVLLRRRQWLALAAGVCVWPAHATWHERRQLFGSPADLLLPEGTPGGVVAEVWQGLAQMNRRWNAWKPGELNTLNQALARGEAATPPAPLRALIQGAAVMERLSMGCFNAGIGGLVGQWGFHADVMRPGARPAPAALAVWTRSPPSLSQLQWRGATVRSTNPGLQLDFGGYAKGVALDWAMARLRRAGVQHALLNLGGNLAAMGDHPGAAGASVVRPWQVGLRDPHGSGLLARVRTRGQEAVVTSGSYERFRLLDGERFTHIIDPATGRPAPELVSVTVLHACAALADAAATALLVVGPLRWRQVAARMGVDQVMVVHADGRQEVSPALQPRLEAPI